MTSLMRTSLPSRIQAYPSLRAEGVAIHGCNCHAKVLRVGFVDHHVALLLVMTLKLVYPSLRAAGVAIHGCNCHAKVLQVGFVDHHVALLLVMTLGLVYQ